MKEAAETPLRKHYAFKVVIALAILTATTGITSSYSLFMTAMCRDLGISATAYGLIYTITSYAQIIGTPLITIWYKRSDSRIVVGTCVLGLGLSWGLSGLCTAMWQFYALSVVAGFVQGLLILLLVTDIIGRWFTVNVATMVGIVGMMRAIGSTIYSAVGGWLIDTVDWRMTWIIFGAAYLVLTLPCCAFLRKDPAELGLKPYGFHTAQGAAEEADSGKPEGLTLKFLMKQPMFLLLMVNIGVMTVGNVMYGYLNDFLQTEKGMSSTTAGFCNSALMAGGAIFYVVIGRVFDKNPKLATILCYVGSIIAYPVLIFTNNMSYLGFLICFFLIGTTYQPSGGMLYPAMVRELGGDKDYTMHWAFQISVLNFTGALGSTGWGACLDWLGYEKTFTLCSVLYAICTVLFIGCMVASRKKWRKLPEWTAEEAKV